MWTAPRGARTWWAKAELLDTTASTGPTSSRAKARGSSGASDHGRLQDLRQGPDDALGTTELREVVVDQRNPHRLPCPATAGRSGSLRDPRMGILADPR